MIQAVLAIAVTAPPTTEPEVSSLVHAAAFFVYKFVVTVDVRRASAATRHEERIAMFDAFFPSLLAIAVEICPAIRVTFPEKWREVGAPLLCAIAQAVVEPPPDLAPQLLLVALIYTELPDAEFEESQEHLAAFYGMAYGPDGADIAHPRQSAGWLFRKVRGEPAETAVFLSEQPYSEALMHLTYGLCADTSPPPPELMALVRAFPADIPPFHALTRLRLLASIVPWLGPDELAFLLDASFVLMQEPGDPLRFTVGVEVLKHLLTHKVAVTEAHIQLLVEHAEASLDALGLQALALVPSRFLVSRTFIERVCKRMADLVSEVNARHWDRLEFEGLCHALATHLRVPGCDPDIEAICELARHFVPDEQTNWFGSVMEATVALPDPAVRGILEIALNELGTQRHSGPLFVEELALVVCSFVCAHAGDLVGGFGGDIARQMCAVARRVQDPEQIPYVARVLAALVQVRVMDGIEEIIDVGMGLIGAQIETIRHAGVEVLASAIAVGFDVNLPAEVFQMWVDMIERGYFATDYLRFLSIAAFAAFVERHPEAGRDLEEVVQKLMLGEIEPNSDFFAGNEEFLEGARMPVLLAAPTV
jgi:hypothetical protein